MKPAAVVLVLSLGVMSGGAPARAQSPWQYEEPLALPFEAAENMGHWPGPWSPRPPLVAEGADLWSDYRGACIEHDLYRPRFLASPGGQHARRPILAAFGDWLDGLFGWQPRGADGDCPYCTAAGGLPNPGMAADSAQPAAPSGARPAPFLAPVPLPEPEPRPRVQTAPIPPTPVQVVPVEPGPAAPAPQVQPPINAIPKLPPPRKPIVELAPEPALPPELPTPAIPIPSNRVPRPGEQLPRNVIPR